MNKWADDRRDIALVVDDSPETLKVLTDALEEAGLTVLVARDGETALSLVDRVQPDVVLMDAVMPSLDGFETCLRLKRREDFLHVPVIFLTGLSETEHIVKALNAGGVDYVTKPIVPDELVARIGVHIANARIAQGARAALDATGRALMAATLTGEILWCTAQASELCARAQGGDGAGHMLPPEVRQWIADCIAAQDPRQEQRAFGGAATGNVKFTYIGQTGPDEYLFRVADLSGPDEVTRLQTSLTLTHREAEVLLWISQGKSNRDIGEILSLSPRTVNKHLEQIFTKLGVENRTAAAALAIRTIVSADDR